MSSFHAKNITCNTITYKCNTWYSFYKIQFSVKVLITHKMILYHSVSVTDQYSIDYTAVTSNSMEHTASTWPYLAFIPMIIQPCIRQWPTTSFLGDIYFWIFFTDIVSSIQLVFHYINHVWKITSMITGVRQLMYWNNGHGNIYNIKYHNVVHRSKTCTYWVKA